MRAAMKALGRLDFLDPPGLRRLALIAVTAMALTGRCDPAHGNQVG
jgi:hypothetical protein